MVWYGMCSVMWYIQLCDNSIVIDTQGHPKPLASVASAHQQPITCMEFLEDRYNL